MNNRRCDDTAVAMMMLLILLRWLHRRFRHSIMHNAHFVCGRYVDRAFRFWFLDSFLLLLHLRNGNGIKAVGYLWRDDNQMSHFRVIFIDVSIKWNELLSLPMQLRSVFFVSHTHKHTESMHRCTCVCSCLIVVELMFQDKTNSLLCSFPFVHFTINSFQSVSSFNPFLCIQIECIQTIYCCIFLISCRFFLFIYLFIFYFTLFFFSMSNFIRHTSIIRRSWHCLRRTFQSAILI